MASARPSACEEHANANATVSMHHAVDGLGVVSGGEALGVVSGGSGVDALGSGGDALGSGGDALGSGGEDQVERQKRAASSRDHGDRDFNPTAEQLIDAMDDERTLAEDETAHGLDTSPAELALLQRVPSPSFLLPFPPSFTTFQLSPDFYFLFFFPPPSLLL